MEATPQPIRPPLRPDDGRLVRGRKSRARILAAARDLFHEHGFDGATLRAIAERAGMGASSIYRHINTKEELLIDDLAARQEEAWRRFRASDDRSGPTRERVLAFFAEQHRLLSEDADFTTIALRALTHPEARVGRCAARWERRARPGKGLRRPKAWLARRAPAGPSCFGEGARFAAWSRRLASPPAGMRSCSP